MTDYAHTLTADRNRDAKARALASWCWDRGITPTDLGDADPATLARAARDADVNPPSAETLNLVVDLLEQMAAWADAHPDNDRAQGGTIDRPSWWVGRPALAIVRDAPARTAGCDVPRGLDQLAALGPIPRDDAPCIECGLPAVVIVLDTARCGHHPPQEGEWGHALDWTPNARTGACPGACYCGRCGQYPRPARRRHLEVAR